MIRFRTFRAGLALLSLLSLATSCKKGNDVFPDDSGTNSGVVASFMNVRFRMAAFQLDPPQDMDGDGQPDSDLMRFMRPCDLDNTILFEKSGKVAGGLGTLRCDDDTDPAATKPDTWTYDNGTKTLRIKDGETSEVSEMNVVEASASVLKVNMQFAEDGHTLTAILTWKAA